MGYSYKIKEEDKFPKGEKKTQDGVESTITDYDPTTRTVEWDIEYVPAFDSVFKEFQELNSYLTSLSNKTDDKEVDEIQMEVKELFNKYRTHIRNNYPEFYKKYQVEEMSTTGGGAGEASFTGGTGMQYATPYAFRKKEQKANDKAHKEVNESTISKSRAKSSLKQIKQGYRDDGMGIFNAKVFAVKDGKEIELKNQSDLDKHSTGYEYILKENIGAILGPGPKASQEGVKDNAYVKQFKYSLVPKNIKGSGLEVNQIFETDTDRGDSLDNFHTQRIEAFDEIEKELNQIYQMLSSAKSETIDYYNDSPSSWGVVKPTDLILDYIKDIKSLLQK